MPPGGAAVPGSRGRGSGAGSGSVPRPFFPFLLAPFFPAARSPLLPFTPFSPSTLFSLLLFPLFPSPLILPSLHPLSPFSVSSPHFCASFLFSPFPFSPLLRSQEHSADLTLSISTATAPAWGDPRHCTQPHANPSRTGVTAQRDPSPPKGVPVTTQSGLLHLLGGPCHHTTVPLHPELSPSLCSVPPQHVVSRLSFSSLLSLLPSGPCWSCLCCSITG